MYQQLWGNKVEKKLYLGVREHKRLSTTGLDDVSVCSVNNKDVASVLQQNTTMPDFLLLLTIPLSPH
jgi:hypothetical protein